MKRKLGLVLAVVMAVGLLSATVVSAEENYQDYLNYLDYLGDYGDLVDLGDLGDLSALYGDALIESYAQEPTEENLEALNILLMNGQNNSDVLALQQKLIALGYDTGGADGIFGEKTEAAVRQFQTDRGLYVDGIAGDMTMAALGGTSAPAASSSSYLQGFSGFLKNGSRGDNVKELQIMLNQAGFDTGGTDGIFGAITDAAVRKFQQQYGVEVDGIVGNLTLSKLREILGADTAAPAATATPAATTTTTPAVAATSSGFTSQSLRKGMTGTYVQQMQTLLTQLGFNTGGTDGIFGANTEAAVRRFQQENGIDTDGIAGPITLGVLSQKAGTGSASEEAATPDRREETNISPVSSNTSINDWANSANLSSGASGFGLIKYGDISGDVYMVQNLLKQLGYDVPVDGYCYESTIEAIKQFQKVNGLTADGIFGPATAYRLENSPLPNNTTDTGWVTDTISSHVDSIIAAATNDSMTQDEKLRAVFNYIADRGNYAYSLDRIPPYTAADWPVVYANDMIANKSGDCHGTAALFGYAARKLGYDAYWCNTDGGHGWVEINGKIYDPLYQNASSHPADVYGWTYEQASSAGLDAGYRRLSGQAKTYRYIQVPTTK